MNSNEIKKIMITELFNTQDYIKQVNEIEYRMRCPFCGDSQRNLNTGHLYVRIDPDDNYPMLYNCFKCGEHGIVDNEFLTMAGIYDTNLKSSILSMNKNSDKIDSKKMDNTSLLMYDFKLPEIKRSFKTDYVEKRLGKKFTDDDFKNMKIITSLKDFLILNNIDYVTCKSYLALKLEESYVGFLTFGGSYILFRDVTGKEKIRWFKYPITRESHKSRVFYSMSTDIDIFTKEDITINMGEGVMDILSAYGNLGYKNPNTINIAVCGKHYLSIISILINMGIVGNNVTLNIFADNDEEFNNKNNNPTTIRYFKKIMHRVKYIFNEINIYYNELDKDIGVPKDKILLKHYKL